MKALIALLIIAGALWISKQLFLSYKSIERRQSSSSEPAAPAPPAVSASANLPGLPSSLETSLGAAEQKGAAGLREWLRSYRTYARDPRLAAIELDYVVLISHQDPAEARRIFNEVKGRTPTFLPIYERVRRLEKTFQ